MLCVLFEFIPSTRRRLIKEKRAPANKIEKLLDVFPRVIGISVQKVKITKEDQSFQALHDLHGRYWNASVEIAASLQLSRNIIVALLSLQSWKPFLKRWLHEDGTFCCYGLY